MERWHIPDATALELIEFPGKVGKEGKRPRFRFTTRQQRITSYLPEIEAALEAPARIKRGSTARLPPHHSIASHRSSTC